MTQPLTQQNERLDLIDGLRGFALLGLLLWHSVERFCLFGSAEFNPAILNTIDPYVNEVMRFLFSGRPFAIFSLMFGFSFFVQMNNAQRRGVNFSGRFLWRLAILLMFATVLSSIYIGQILTQYALIGIPLILLFKARPKLLLLVAGFFLLQIPTVIMFLITSWIPSLKIDHNAVYGLWNEGIAIYASGSLADVMSYNVWKGNLAIVGWAFIHGRLYQTFGLFVLGLLLAKTGFFENTQLHGRTTLRTMLASILCFFLFLYADWLLPHSGITAPVLELVGSIAKTYYNLASTVILVSAIIMLYPLIRLTRVYAYIVSYGRMALTNYVVQPLIAVPVFYGFGLGLYQYFGQTLSLLFGLSIVLVQLYVSRKWMAQFKYGPMEWLWRALTYLSFNIPFKKTSSESTTTLGTSQKEHHNGSLQPNIAPTSVLNVTR